MGLALAILFHFSDGPDAMSYWQDKVAIVTGASKGLGRVIAETLAIEGAKVVMAARGAERLEAAAALLCNAGHDALAVPTDVTDPLQVDALIARCVDHFGRLDMLVNNAGRSARGELAQTTPEEVRELMELNLISVVRCSRAALPHLLESRGHLVNVGSLASKVASRYIGAYALTKFPLAAYSQQLRLELGPQGLHVLLVCPGPIAGDHPREHSADSLAGLPTSAARPGAGAKIASLEPHTVAHALLAACERRKPELVLPGKARWLCALSQLSPRLGDWIVRRMT